LSSWRKENAKSEKTAGSAVEASDPRPLPHSPPSPRSHCRRLHSGSLWLRKLLVKELVPHGRGRPPALLNPPAPGCRKFPASGTHSFPQSCSASMAGYTSCLVPSAQLAHRVRFQAVMATAPAQVLGHMEGLLC
jgi:hypothetical protein